MGTSASFGSRQTWATCLREILFVEDELSQDEFQSVKGIEVYQDEQAVMFLLEVLCGLHSPVLGETEVMGQFKNYLSQIPEDHLLRREPGFLPFLQNTTKEARTKFLSATGSLSYGQIVRRWLKDMPDVALWGFGSLGQELWPWMREKTSAVVVRQPRALDSDVPFLVGQTPKATAHVIAAPLADEAVRALADRSFVIDLRDGALDHPNVRTLQDLFAEIQQLRREREDIVPRCREFLRGKVEEYFSRHQIRPFGWEDLCG
ncbi:MAG: hypothetical protein KF802_08695 [Bdellovibrionaceae bacterium]|nr:hypothetical protein [Pseudobdellovibrionaceae bacterium]MBX3034126.1 hypothetical protein [Pseudobdellovibrionaceae bacterium]